MKSSKEVVRGQLNNRVISKEMSLCVAEWNEEARKFWDSYIPAYLDIPEPKVVGWKHCCEEEDQILLIFALVRIQFNTMDDVNFTSFQTAFRKAYGILKYAPKGLWRRAAGLIKKDTWSPKATRRWLKDFKEEYQGITDVDTIWYSVLIPSMIE